METSSFDGPKNVFTNSNYILPLIIDKPYCFLRPTTDLEIGR